MSIAALIARLLLAVVFFVAGVGKLTDQAGSRQMARDFGVPSGLARPFGLLLPLLELAAAVALLPVATALWGAVAALGLLLAFMAAIAVNLARGRHPDCHCFGQIDSGPVGGRTLLRDGALVAVAGFAVWGTHQAPAAGVSGWLGSGNSLEVIGLIGVGVALLLALLEGWAAVELLRRHGSLLLRVERLESLPSPGPALPAPTADAGPGLPVGTPAPAFSLSGLFGETLTLESLRSGSLPVLLAFVAPSCGPCIALMPELAQWQREAAGRVAVAYISSGSAEDNRAKAGEFGVASVLIQQESEVANAYQAWGTPSAVLVNADGRIGSSVAQGADAIRSLWARVAPLGASAVQQPAAAPSANGGGPAAAVAGPAMADRIGSAAPSVRLPDLGGQMVDLETFRGRETLVLFWNTGCGFCQQLLPELKSWESSRPATAPALLVVSTGGVPENQAQGFASSVLLDEGFRTGMAFGAGGTPSAVLVGSDGRIASPVAVGGPAVMALARGEGR
jgi:thiol-disulfide isomerase/thioredoxin